MTAATAGLRSPRLSAIWLTARNMAGYEPNSRRPIANAFRRTASLAVRWCVRGEVHPDVISYLSNAASLAAGICFWLAGSFPILLLMGPILCYVRLWLNMLDGMVALAAGKASPRGEIVNDLPDRLSDLLIFAGVAHSGLAHLASGYWAAIMALGTAYVGTLGQAIAGRREFGGWMSKPWRMVTLHAGAWITFALIQFNHGRFQFAGLSVLDYTCLVIILGCMQTIWVRLAATLRVLKKKTNRIVGD
jgi:phosphatidylglycerophosphate synthase